jgi:hypothetical protein
LAASIGIELKDETAQQNENQQKSKGLYKLNTNKGSLPFKLNKKQNILKNVPPNKRQVFFSGTNQN